jgi:hypothetical protein
MDNGFTYVIIGEDIKLYGNDELELAEEDK